MKISTRKLAASAVLGIILCGGIGTAYAGNTYKSFSTTVPRTNGSAYTGNQTKAITDANVQMSSLVVGGDHTLDAQAQSLSASPSSAWVRNLGDGKNINIKNSMTKGTSLRIHFSNDLTTLQRVQAEGKWRSQ